LRDLRIRLTMPRMVTRAQKKANPAQKHVKESP